jgi:hypothetical protein
MNLHLCLSGSHRLIDKLLLLQRGFTITMRGQRQRQPPLLLITLDARRGCRRRCRWRWHLHLIVHRAADRLAAQPGGRRSTPTQPATPRLPVGSGCVRFLRVGWGGRNRLGDQGCGAAARLVVAPAAHLAPWLPLWLPGWPGGRSWQ